MDNTGDTQSAVDQVTAQLEQDDLIIYEANADGVSGKYYWVKAMDFRQHLLPDALKGAPEFLVGLGVVAADIPPVPMAGSACVLLNLASIRNASPKQPPTTAPPTGGTGGGS